MTLLDSHAREVEDHWESVADGAAVPVGVPVIVSLARLRQGVRARRVGVVLPPDAGPADVAPLLDGLSLVAVTFPKFRDGRGFTLGRALREHCGWQGELRAVGHVLPDQYVALLRCGFSTVQVPEGQAVASWTRMASLRRVGGQAPVPLLRRLAIPYR